MLADKQETVGLIGLGQENSRRKEHRAARRTGMEEETLQREAILIIQTQKQSYDKRSGSSLAVLNRLHYLHIRREKRKQINIPPQLFILSAV